MKSSKTLSAFLRGLMPPGANPSAIPAKKKTALS
jgi:hypothetical protein